MENKCRTKSSKFTVFLHSLKELFYIGRCKCELKAVLCSCGLIPERLKDFMMDQHNDRRATLPEYEAEIEEQALTCTVTETTEESQGQTYMPDDTSNGQSLCSVNAQDAYIQRRGPYTPRYNAFNFAMMCDRLGVSDRKASALATSLLEDIGVKDDRGNPVIMDKSKVRREKAKCRQKVLLNQYDTSKLIAFSFDGRKNDSLTMEKIDNKFHPRMVKEPHIVVLKEPHSQLLGYIKVENEDSENKVIKLKDFFIKKEMSLDSLIGICCDGERVNTGVRNGILRRFEIQLNKPLHWFVCLLHFNELPLRHLFDTLEKSSTTGPRTTTGTLNKQIEACENLPVC